MTQWKKFCNDVCKQSRCRNTQRMTKNIGTERKIIKYQLRIDGLVHDKIFGIGCIDLFAAKLYIVRSVLMHGADACSDLINAIKNMPQTDKAIKVIGFEFL